jgi:hypothetical protein
MPTSTLSPNDFPMPDLHCPTWCQRDHAADWQRHVAVGLDTRRIPAVGGGFLPESPLPIEEWCTLDYFTSSHLAPIVDQPVSETFEGERDRWSLDLTAEPGDEQAYLYLHADGPMTAADVRRMVAHLLEAADLLDEITR